MLNSKIVVATIISLLLNPTVSAESDTNSEAYKLGEEIGEKLIINQMQISLATATLEFGISARTMNWVAACMIDANGLNDANANTEHCSLTRQQKINTFGEANIRDDNSVIDENTKHLQERFGKIVSFISVCSEYYGSTAYEFLDEHSISYEREPLPSDIESSKIK